MKRKIIHREVCLENFKSRFPGLFPFIDAEGKTIFPSSGTDVKDNWGMIPMSLKDSSYEATYSENGSNVLTYSDMVYRYHRIMKALSESMVLSNVYLSGGDTGWSEGKGTELVDIMDMGPDSIVSIEEVEKNYLKTVEYDSDGEPVNVYRLTAEDILAGKSKVLAVHDYSFIMAYNFGSGGEAFNKFFDRMLGILRVPSSIAGDNVPYFINYFDIQRKYDELIGLKGCIGDDSVKKKYVSRGGDEMVQFLKKNYNLFKETTDSIRKMSFSVPIFSLGVKLDQYADALGAYGRELFMSNEPGNGVAGKSLVRSEECSRLEDLKDKTNDAFTETETGIEQIDGHMRRFGKVMRGSGNSWSVVEDSSKYEEVGSFSNLTAPDVQGKDCLVIFDNRYRFQEVRPSPGDMIKHKNGELTPVEEGEDCGCPFRSKIFFETDESEIVNINDGEKSMVYGGEDLIYDDIYCNGKYMSVKNDDLFIPYNVNEAFGLKKTGDEKYPYTGSFVYSIDTESSEPQISYVFGSPVTVDENMNVTGFPNLEEDADDPGKASLEGDYGIFYHEKRKLRVNKQGYSTIAGRRFRFYYDDLEPDEVMVVSEEFQAQKKTAIAQAVYRRYDNWYYEDIPVSVPDDNMCDFDVINDPVIDVTVNRGMASAFESYFKIMECNTFEDLSNYGNNYFKIR